MNILKRQLALLLVLAMTLTMLPMPAHADEVTEPETKSVIVEETTEKTVVSKEEVFTNVSKMPVESAEPEASSKESATSEAETPADTVEDSDATIAEELVANTSKDAPVSDSIEESESIINIDGTAAEDTEADEDKDYSATVESEEAEDSESDTQEATGQAEPMTDVPVAAVFSFRRSVANAVTSECAHSETEIAWDTKDQVINCKSISDTQHQISGYQYRYCTSCYQRVGESFAATELAAHELDNSGYCSWCGYRSSTGSGSGSDSDSDSDCDHANTAIGWDPDQLGPWYAQYSDTQHKVTGYRYTYCTDCHARVRDESGSNNNYYSEELEGHTLNASGECTFCGYGQESACNHLRDSSSGEVSYTDPPRYEQFDEQTHYIYRPTYYDCIYCGEPMEEPGYTISNEPHAPENGVCIHCGYEVGEDYCPHLTREFVWDTDHSFTYEQHSDDEHIVRGYKYARCTSCLNRLADSYQSWDYENHSVNASGKCTLCGYESDADTGCTHENVLTGYAPLHDPPRYEQYNDTQHFVYHIFKKTCRDCGETLSDGEEVVSLEGHVLTNGKCNYCGYGFGEDYCTHPDTDVMWSSAPMTYTSLNEEQHEVEGCQYHYCTSCYKRICADFPVKEWEDHTFDSTGDCTLCNYRVGCEHKQTTMKLYDTLYESLNKDSHEVTRLYSKVCADPDCGKVLVSVETSYTETDIEDHDFTGNTCLLCNYTVADQLSATVTASGLTANKGDNISATVSVVGGTGGYRFSWKVLKDSSVVAENPITTSASCGTNAYEEGSYVFQVTVTDSGGNTVTAQSGAITVSHACQYETVTSTELVIQSLTHHTVETTTYEECTICHEKRNEVTDVQWVEHTPIDADSYGHEAAHPHKKYFICECGSHPYLDGEYHTANGKVQDESVCCICHDHKYGAEEETPDGTRQKTCTNCGLTTVTHTHEYELIQTEKFINPDETKHYVETTSTHKCKTCGHEKPGITVTIDEPHSPKNPKDYTYRTAHPHQRYAVCECGKEFNVPGEYEKVNGKLLEADVCCICHGHKFGEPTVGYGGDLYKTCKNCYYTELVSVSAKPEVEEEKHLHNWTIDRSNADEHPHQYTAECACGAKETYNKMFMACCQCTGNHYWSFVRLSDGKTYKQVCDYCGAIQSATPTEQVQDYYKIIDMITYRHNVAKKYQEEHNVDSTATAIWKTIADQATEKLMDVDFVTTNETLNTFSENSSISGAFKAAYGELTRETWDEQQTDLWETLLLRMLTEYYEDNADSAQEYKKDANTWLGRLKKVSDKTGEILSDDGTYKELEKSISYVDEFIMGLEMQVTVLYNEGKNTDALAVQEELQYFKDKKKAYEDEIASAKATGADFKKSAQGIGLLMDCIGVLAEGTSSAQAVAERNDAFAEMLIHSEQNIAVLDNIYAAAVSVGNTNLANAADKIKRELEEEMEEATNQFLTETGAFFKGVTTEIGKKGLSKGFNWIIEESAKTGEAALGTAVKDAGSILKVLGMSAKGLRSILDWGGAYDAAQKLMTINQMDATMNITQVLKDNDSPYMVELWGLLQAEGCEHAQEFLNAWEDGTGLNSTDLGIDNGGLFGESDLPKVLREIDIERNYYITALKLPLEKSN